MMPPAARFDTDRHRAAAAIVCGTVTGAFHGFDPGDAAARLVDDVEGLTAADVTVGASFVISKLIADVETIYGIPHGQTLERLGLWVATDEIAPRQEGG